MPGASSNPRTSASNPRAGASKWPGTVYFLEREAPGGPMEAAGARGDVDVNVDVDVQVEVEVVWWTWTWVWKWRWTWMEVG